MVMAVDEVRIEERTEEKATVDVDVVENEKATITECVDGEDFDEKSRSTEATVECSVSS